MLSLYFLSSQLFRCLSFPYCFFCWLGYLIFSFFLGFVLIGLVVVGWYRIQALVSCEINPHWLSGMRESEVGGGGWMLEGLP